MVEIIKTQRGKDMIVHDNHIYTYDRYVSSDIRWRCRNRQCSAHLLMHSDYQIIHITEHNHAGNSSEVERLIQLHRIKERAREGREKAKDIAISTISEVTVETANQMPSIKSLKRIVKRTRNETGTIVSEDIRDIPDDLKLDGKGNTFLHKDTGFNDPERVIVFSSIEKHIFFPNIQTLLIDGTFATSPHGFYQILIIHGMIFNKAYPLFYCLLKTKTTSIYTKCFQLCDEIVKLNPLYVISDYEKSLCNAISSFFTSATHKGCFFHFCQTIFRRIQTTGMLAIYKNKEVGGLFLRQCMLLGFLPSDRVRSVYCNIKGRLAIEDSKMSEFCNYFEKMFIGSTAKEASYPIQFWNVYESTLLKIPRTTNFAERFNRTLNESVGVRHPNIAHLIDALKQEELLDSYNLSRARAGIYTFNTVNIKREEYLYTTILSYAYFDDITFLKVIDSHLKLNFHEQGDEIIK